MAGPGGVAQWTWQPPYSQLTQVRIPQGYKVFKKNIYVLQNDEKVLLTFHVHIHSRKKRVSI
jgi:hypothetical protein